MFERKEVKREGWMAFEYPSLRKPLSSALSDIFESLHGSSCLGRLIWVSAKVQVGTLVFSCPAAQLLAKFQRRDYCERSVWWMRRRKTSGVSTVIDEKGKKRKHIRYTPEAFSWECKDSRRFPAFRGLLRQTSFSRIFFQLRGST